MTQTARTVRIQLLIAFMCVAMLAYFVLLLVAGSAIANDGEMN